MGGRSCSVCAHEDSFSINESLVLGGGSNRRIATQYGLSEAAIRRHREHIPELLVEASEHTDAFEADAILMRVEALECETLEALEQAKDRDELGYVLAAVREQRRNLELVSKIRQIIQSAPQVNILVHPQWVSFRTAILDALEPHPHARADVMRAIEEASRDG